jgi:hypothetical protein
MPSRTSPANLLASAALAVILAVSAGGCSNIGPRETTGSVSAVDAAPPGRSQTMCQSGARNGQAQGSKISDLGK